MTRQTSGEVRLINLINVINDGNTKITLIMTNRNIYLNKFNCTPFFSLKVLLISKFGLQLFDIPKLT